MRFRITRMYKLTPSAESIMQAVSRLILHHAEGQQHGHNAAARARFASTFLFTGLLLLAGRASFRARRAGRR